MKFNLLLFTLFALSPIAHSANFTISDTTDGVQLDAEANNNPILIDVNGVREVVSRGETRVFKNFQSLGILLNSYGLEDTTVTTSSEVTIWSSYYKDPGVLYKPGSYSFLGAQLNYIKLGKHSTQKPTPAEPEGEECLAGPVTAGLRGSWVGQLDRTPQKTLTVRGEIRLKDIRMQTGFYPGPATFGGEYGEPEVFSTPHWFNVSDWFYLSKSTGDYANQSFQFSASTGDTIKFGFTVGVEGTKLKELQFFPNGGHGWGSLTDDNVDAVNVKFYCQ